jgi:hypothetical protein
MGTVFWLPSTGASAVSPTPSATDWDGHVNGSQRLKMVLDRINSALSTVAYAPDAADHLVDLASMHSQYVSDILPPQAIAAQQIIFGIRCLEAVATNNLWPAWKLYCVKADGSLPALATIVAWFKSATAEMATAITGYCETRAGSAVTLNEPWRLVLEFGADGLPTNTATDTHNHSFAVGDPLATGAGNMPQQADTTACTPMLIFSNDLVTKFTRRRAMSLIGI